MVGHEGRTGLTKALLSSSSGPIISVIHHRSPRQLSSLKKCRLIERRESVGRTERAGQFLFLRLILPLASLNVEAISN